MPDNQNKAYEGWLAELPERCAELTRGDSKGVSLEDAYARIEAEHQADLAEIEAGLAEADRGEFATSTMVGGVLRKYLDPRLTPRMRAILDSTRHLSGEERRKIIRAQFIKKSASD